MKLSISRETLLKNLKHMQSVVEKRTSIPILSNVLIKAENNRLMTTATDNDMTVKGGAEAFVETEGATTVSAHKLYEIISKIPEGVMVNMELKDNGGRLAITAGKAKFSLACLSPEAFPDTDTLADGVTFNIPSAAFKKTLGKAIFAASTDETRQYLNGVYMHVTDDEEPKLRFVATDGHRLSRVEMDLPEGAKEMNATILPRKTVGELRKLCDEAKEVTLRVSDKKIQCETEVVTLTSKVIDGAFPDYDRVIPYGNEKEMDISRQMLMQAVDRVAILSHEKSRSIKFSVKPNNLMITANNPDQENAVEDLKVEYSADEVSIGFNAKYVSEIGNHIESDDVSFFFKDGTSPVMVKDPADPSALFVVMPMRI